MRPRAWIIFAGFALFSASAFAQDSASSGEKKDKNSYEPSEKILAGSQHYFSSDTSLYIGFQEGFYGSAAVSVYKSDISSKTSTIYVTGGKDWSQASLFGTLSVTPESNNYRATSFDFGGSVQTADRNFRSVAGLDINITEHTETIPSIRPRQPNHDVHIGQTTPTLSLSQRYYGTKAALYLSKSHYTANIQKLSDRVNPVSGRLSGLEGLLQGFPDTTIKGGLYQDLPTERPITVWGTISHTRLLVTNQDQTGVADDDIIGVDVDLFSYLTTTLEYDYLRQTGEPKSNYAGITVTFRF